MTRLGKWLAKIALALAGVLMVVPLLNLDPLTEIAFGIIVPALLAWLEFKSQQEAHLNERLSRLEVKVEVLLELERLSDRVARLEGASSERGSGSQNNL